MTRRLPAASRVVSLLVVGKPAEAAVYPRKRKAMEEILIP